jgi:Tfp pilus assembly protein PilX
LAASLDYVPERIGLAKEQGKGMLVELWMWLIVVLMLTLVIVQNIGLRERITKLEATLRR